MTTLCIEALSPIAPMGYETHNERMGIAKNTRKERVRLALSECPVSRVKISEETDIPYGSLNSFVSRGSLSGEYMLKLEAWLAQHNFFSGPMVSAADGDAFQKLSVELHQLADKMADASIRAKIRIDSFISAIESYHRTLEEHRAMLSSDPRDTAPRESD